MSLVPVAVPCLDLERAACAAAHAGPNAMYDRGCRGFPQVPPRSDTAELPGVEPEGFQAFFVGRRGKLSSKGYWSPEQVEQLRSLLSQGLPFAKIALQMGASRNAVIGKAHRLGLKSTSAGGRLRGAAAPESAEVAGARPWEADSVPGSQAVIKYYAGKAGPKAVPAAASLPPAALTASPGLRRNYDRLERNRAQRVKRNEAERLRL